MDFMKFRVMIEQDEGVFVAECPGTFWKKRQSLPFAEQVMLPITRQPSFSGSRHRRSGG